MGALDGPLQLRRTEQHRSVAREEEEFRAFYAAYYRPVLQILGRLTGNAADAEDLGTEVFSRFLRHADLWGWPRNPGGWLYRTATHVGIDFVRSRSRRAEEELTDDVAAGPASEEALAALIRQSRAQSVRDTLARMKPDRAQILLMRADDAPYQEIADALHVSLRSVGTLLHRAEEEFRMRYRQVSATQERRSHGMHK